MKQEEFLNQLQDLYIKCYEIVKKKNHDYANSDDPFANFTLCEEMGLCDVEIGILMRITDKFKRITTFLQKGELKVENESVEDAIIDCINYFGILYCYMNNKDKDEGVKLPSRHEIFDIRHDPIGKVVVTDINKETKTVNFAAPISPGPIAKAGFVPTSKGKFHPFEHAKLKEISPPRTFEVGILDINSTYTVLGYMPLHRLYQCCRDDTERIMFFTEEFVKNNIIR